MHTNHITSAESWQTCPPAAPLGIPLAWTDLVAIEPHLLVLEECI
jgi:hypothetical protein